MKIDKAYLLPFPVETVYAAWVSSNTVIVPATAMDIKPEVGGHYRLLIESPTSVSKNEGIFLAVEQNKHVRYTWEWNSDGDITQIDVVFMECKEGCKIILVHSGFRNQPNADAHSSGWDSYITGFSAFLQNKLKAR